MHRFLLRVYCIYDTNTIFYFERLGLMIPSQGLSWLKSPTCLLLVRFETLNPGTDHIDSLLPVSAEHFHLAKKGKLHEFCYRQFLFKMCMDLPAGLHLFFTCVKHALTQLPRGAHSNSPSHILEVSEHISSASANMGEEATVSPSPGAVQGAHIHNLRNCVST